MSTDLICFTRGIGVINTLEGQLFKFRRPSAALIISGVALVFAMGGGAYAAVQLAPGSVTHADLAKNSVWHANIGTGAVQMNNLSTSIRKQLRKAGERGPAGPQGPAGANGSNGTNGVSSQGGGTTVIGPQGPSGVNSPLVYTYSGTTGPDSGVCSNNNGTGNAGWATDTFNTTFVVEPQSDGSYVVSKTVQGTFVTVAGVSYPLDSNCASSQTGGQDGTFYGTEVFTVARDTGFNPSATCGSTCSPNTTSTGGSASEAQNAAFVNAFFPIGSYSGVADYDFEYTLGSQHMSQTASFNSGDLTNG